MSKSVMVTTGHILPSAADALLGTVRLDVIHAHGEWLDATWDYELCSPFWRLYVNRQAGAQLELDGRRLALRAETVYLLPAGLRFQTRLAKNVTRVWQDFVHFEVTGFPPTLLRKLFPGPVSLAPTSELAAPLSAWREGGARGGATDLAQRLRALALVHAAFAVACGQATNEGRAAWAAWLAMPPVVAPALRLLEERTGAEGAPGLPDNDEMASACGLGTRQFLRRFGEAVGLSPGQYALERRVARAAESLTRGDESLEALAARLGFADRFHFSKVFRARVGVPPAAYRRMHGGCVRGVNGASSIVSSLR